MKFEVGDRVIISDISEFFWQSSQQGKITNSQYLGGELWYDVKFPSGYQNSYREKDLKHIKIDNWQGEFNDD